MERVPFGDQCGLKRIASLKEVVLILIISAMLLWSFLQNGPITGLIARVGCVQYKAELICCYGREPGLVVLLVED